VLKIKRRIIIIIRSLIIKYNIILIRRGTIKVLISLR